MTTRKVCVVGSTRFPMTAGIGAQVVDELRGLGDVAILTRGTGEFETFLMHVCPLLELRCLTYPSTGGPDNWRRDVELVHDADEVLAYVSPRDLEKHDRMTGTLHIVDKALDQKKPVRMFTEVDGRIVYAAASQEDAG